MSTSTSIEKETDFLALFAASPFSFTQRYRVGASDHRGKREATYTTLKRAIGIKDVREHFAGGVAIVAKPVQLDGTCYWAAIDFDSYDQQAVDEFLAGVKRLNLPIECFRSKSGGVHGFVFFDKPLPATEVRALLAGWARALGHPNAEIFPKQNQTGNGNLGNGIALPFHGDLEGFARFVPQYYSATNGHQPPAPSSSSSSPSSPSPSSSSSSSAIRELGTEKIAAALPEGKRNNALTSLAGTMCRRGMGQKSIEAALQAENLARCEPPLSVSEITAIAKSVSRYEPAECETPLPPQFSEEALAQRFSALHTDDLRYVAALGRWLRWED